MMCNNVQWFAVSGLHTQIIVMEIVLVHMEKIVEMVINYSICDL